MRHYFIFLGFILIISCTKQKQDNTTANFVKFKTDDVSYNFVSGQNNYEDELFDNEQNSVFGGLYVFDGPSIQNVFQTKLNKFLVVFHNISIDKIKKGTYKYYSNNNISDSAIEIIWMQSNEWSSLIDMYKMSNNYQICLNNMATHGDAESICSTALMHEDNFFTTKNYKQQVSEFTINAAYYKEFKNKTENTSQAITNDLVIEGNFKCNAVSNIDTIDIRQVSGGFRIRIYSNL
jgi:hypothetical protein